MPSPSAEWSLLPLFALPVGLAIGFVVYAGAQQDSAVRSYRDGGAVAARAWLDELPDGGAAARERFARAVAEMASKDAHDVRFRRGAQSGIVRLDSTALGSSEWTIAPHFPAGLGPLAVADARVRLAAESGTPAAQLEGADAGTTCLAALLAAPPDVTSLRTAPLPASTKAFVARRTASSEGAWTGARRLLDALSAYERVAARGALGPGVYEESGVAVLVAGGNTPVLVLPNGIVDGALGAGIAFSHPERDDVVLSWSAGAEPAPHGAVPLWSGRLDTPIAGTWTLARPHGDAWWRARVVSNWGPLVAVGVAGLTLVPTFLLTSLRRQRLLDAERARFLNEVAHDLRTPLTSLRLYADMLAADRGDAASRARYSEVIAREAARLTELLANLLDLSRLENGKRTFELETLTVRDAVDAAVRDFRALHPQRAADVTAAGDAAAKVRADRSALARCLANLLDNAGKFTAPGDAIRCTWTLADGAVRMEVADDGPGIAEDERESIFERYRRGARATGDGVPGTGLGLSLVRELAQGMGGRVTLGATSKGAAFELTLPGGDA